MPKRSQYENIKRENENTFPDIQEGKEDRDQGTIDKDAQSQKFINIFSYSIRIS